MITLGTITSVVVSKVVINSVEEDVVVVVVVDSVVINTTSGVAENTGITVVLAISTVDSVDNILGMGKRLKSLTVEVSSSITLTVLGCEKKSNEFSVVKIGVVVVVVSNVLVAVVSTTTSDKVTFLTF